MSERFKIGARVIVERESTDKRRARQKRCGRATIVAVFDEPFGVSLTVTRYRLRFDDGKERATDHADALSPTPEAIATDARTIREEWPDMLTDAAGGMAGRGNEGRRLVQQAKSGDN